jgi:hypothetical protein
MVQKVAAKGIVTKKQRIDGYMQFAFFGLLIILNVSHSGIKPFFIQTNLPKS